jgi:hypothetical protein
VQRAALHIAMHAQLSSYVQRFQPEHRRLCVPCCITPGKHACTAEHPPGAYNCYNCYDCQETCHKAQASVLHTKCMLMRLLAVCWLKHWVLKHTLCNSPVLDRIEQKEHARHCAPNNNCAAGNNSTPHALQTSLVKHSWQHYRSTAETAQQNG